MPETLKHIGLFFGSFNPVHVGHLALANYIAENSEIDEIWFVVSPQNPFKESDELIDAEHRVNMLQESINQYPRFKVCDIELNLPTPSYTYNTLNKLTELYPNYNFSIIMGSDNLINLNRWRNVDEIMKLCSIKIYPRPEYPILKELITNSISVIDAPVFDISSTLIRKGLSEGKNYSYLIPKKAHDYIVKHGLY